ncbi:hypothetical protein [Actinokineospora terrae]|uniref:Uncharacterized protein n=1 Tax=Actinokineospora terrae TaxID=155974 RepID=A0A1H9X7V1_9PSEU|nr:hypothetical protein [Actinokineospora terrae]SES42149.1 hypothetical protein SAMN04487818_113105 [Actinokineospora terrae]
MPEKFGVVEQIGLTCGASTAELLELHRLWARAVSASPELPQEPPKPTEPDTPPPPRSRRRWWPALIVAAAVLALIGGSTPIPPAPVPQWVSGPVWQRGRPNWTTLDRLVDGANHAGLPVLFVYFSWGAGRDGYTYSINDQVASSKWIRTCGTP